MMATARAESPQARRVLSSADSVPSFPESAARLTTLLTKDSANANDFEQVIKPDPGMTANLLRLVNSSYFGLGREIGSVRQAVTFLGTKRLFEIVASASFSQVIPQRLPGYGIDAHTFWMHSVAVAVIAERVAAQTEAHEPDLTFTAALLHDVGKIVISQYLGKKNEAPENPMQAMADERALLETDHAEIGAAVATIWKLPAGTAAASRWHHAPEQAPDDGELDLVDLVHVANTVAHKIGFGAEEEETERDFSPTAVERLGFTREDVDELVELWSNPALAMDEILSVAEALRPQS